MSRSVDDMRLVFDDFPSWKFTMSYGQVREELERTVVTIKAEKGRHRFLSSGEDVREVWGNLVDKLREVDGD